MSVSPLSDDDELAEHFARASRRGDPPDLRVLAAALARIESTTPTDLDEEQHAHHDAVTDLLRMLVEGVASPWHRHRELEGELDAVHDRLARAERTGAWPAAGERLAARVEALEAREARRSFSPWFPSTRFSEAFRGSSEALLERYTDIADRVASHGGPVLDLGCGRGELMGLLRDRGIEVTGVDPDEDAVADARAAGLEVTVGDGLVHLGALPAASLGGLLLIQVVEHLTAQQLVELVALAAEKVRPGGVVVAETINPSSLYVYSHALWLDPTHDKPIHPAYLDFLFREAGFERTEVQWRSPTPAEERLQAVTGEDSKARRLDERDHRTAERTALRAPGLRGHRGPLAAHGRSRAGGVVGARSRRGHCDGTVAQRRSASCRVLQRSGHHGRGTVGVLATR